MEFMNKYSGITFSVFALKTQKPVEHICPFNSLGIIATAFKLGLTVEIIISLFLTSCFARLGEFFQRILLVEEILLRELSIEDISIYSNSSSEFSFLEFLFFISKIILFIF